MTWEQIIGLLITSFVGAVGAVWVYFSKIVIPKIVEARLEERKAVQERLDGSMLYAQKIEELLVNAGISTSKEERLTQLGQAEQILGLLHDDQHFIRDTLAKLLTEVAAKLRELHLVVVRQNDLITALNITLQRQEDEYSKREESS